VNSAIGTREDTEDGAMSEPIVVPVPDEILKPYVKTPTGLYLITIPPDQPFLIAQSGDGYVGVALRCPHAAVPFTELGIVVNDGECLMCQAHGVRFSLSSGEALDDPDCLPRKSVGTLGIYRVVREGDNFVIPPFA
jgi:nitrite reductase/ring-hydroxylating ferredoxin subunit